MKKHKQLLETDNGRDVMTEVKIGMNDFGTLFAILPTGEKRTILVDVHDTQNYGTLLVVNVPVLPEEGE